MALLEFQCHGCGKIFDKLVFGDDRSKISCPQCGSKEYKQVFQGKSLFGQIGSSESDSFVCPAQRSGDCPGCH
ncbi:MAG: hypothetical protein GX160_01065 [Clostridiales bacterium]|nr:hypothetical protein [Clostridiales bacterium]